jgi:multidrug resistance efflux pump
MYVRPRVAVRTSAEHEVDVHDSSAHVAGEPFELVASTDGATTQRTTAAGEVTYASAPAMALPDMARAVVSAADWA